MTSLSQEKGESLLGVACFSQLCGSSPEGSQGASVHQGAPGGPTQSLASAPQSLALDEGLQLAAASLEGEAAGGVSVGTPAIETSPATPPKTARPRRWRNGTDKGCRSDPPFALHIDGKGCSSPSSTAARAFHSSGLAAVAAAVSAASAAAATKTTGNRLGVPQKTSPSRFWLNPSEFSLLAEIRARANAATATQIQKAAEAAVAAFQGKVSTPQLVGANNNSDSCESSLSSDGVPLSSAGDPPGDPSPMSASGRSSWPPPSPSIGLPVAAADPPIGGLKGPSSCGEEGRALGNLTDEGTASGPGAHWLVKGTWNQAESQGGPQGTAWRAYTPDPAEVASSFPSSSGASGEIEELQQSGPGAAEEEADLLAPTQRTEGDGGSTPVASVPTAADCGHTEAILLGPESAAPAAVAASTAIAPAAADSKATAYVSSAAGGSPLQCSLSNDGAAAEQEAPSAAAARAVVSVPQAAGAAVVAAEESASEPREEVCFSLPAVCESHNPYQGFLSEPSTPRRPQMAALAAESSPSTVRARATAPVGPAVAGMATTASHSCSRSGASDGIASPYVTPPRRRQPHGAHEPFGGPPSGLPTPSSASSSSRRRGQLKSTARLAASSLSRATVEATARRFSRLPLGGEASGSSGVGSPSPLKKQKVGEFSQLAGEEGDCNSNGNATSSTSSRALSGSIATETVCSEGSRSQPVVKQETTADTVGQQQPDQPQQVPQVAEGRALSLAVRVHQEVRTATGSRDSGRHLLDWQDDTTRSRGSWGARNADCEVGRERSHCVLKARKQLSRAPVAVRHLEGILGRGLYAFQVEGLLWMLHREGRLPIEGVPSSFSHGPDPSLSQRGPPIGGPPCGGGILADDPGLGKTIQIVSLIAATVQPEAPAESCQPEIAQQERGEEERRSLVLAPASLVPQWEAEIHRICGMNLRVLNIPRRLRETGTLLTPSVLQGAQVVLASYESLLSVTCLCRPSRPRKEKDKKQQQVQRVKVLPTTQGGNDLSGQEEDPFFATVDSSSSGASGAEPDYREPPQEPTSFTPATPGSSPQNSGCSCDLDGRLSRLSSGSSFQRKLRDASTPHSTRAEPRVWPRGAQAEDGSPHAVRTPRTPRRNSVALWGPRGGRCSCVRCFLVGFGWERLVLDEAHLVLRRKRLASTIHAISALYRWGLTATPGPPAGDLAGDPAGDPSRLLRLLGFLGTGDDTGKSMKGGQSAKELTGTCCCASLPGDAACSEEPAEGQHERFVLRRTHGALRRRKQQGKQECPAAKTLLQKIGIHIAMRHPVLPSVQLKLQMLSFLFSHELELYKRIESMASKELASTGREATASAVNSLEWTTRLRQACLHFSLVLGENRENGSKYHVDSGPRCWSSQREGSPLQHKRRLSIRSPGHRLGFQTQTQVDVEALQEQVGVTTTHLSIGESKPRQSTKTQAVLSAVESILRCNRDAKIVIISAFTSFLKLLELHLAEFFRGKYPAAQDVASRVVKLTGEVRIVNRTRAIRQFATERSVNIMLVSTLAASHGVDGLQTAGHLLICEPIMSLGRLRQVLGRLLRIGQSEQQVSVKLFFVGNTIEHRILQLRSPMELADSQFLVSDDGTTLPCELLSRQSSGQSMSRLIPRDDTSFLLGLE